MESEEPKSKLDAEIATAFETGKNAASVLKTSIDDNAPAWFVHPVKKLMLDSRTIPFLFGMGVEALGIAIQAVLGVAAYPVLDVITVGVVIIVLAWYQGKNRVKQDSHTVQS